MGKYTEISWTDATWNVARGCDKVDQDCKFCYIYRESLKSTRYNPFKVVRTKGAFRLPLTIKEPCKIFVSSLTDFFHPDIDSYRHEAWEIMRNTKHTYQILTKRPERITLPDFWDEIKDRVWLGTSVGSNKGIQRALDLIKFRDVAMVLFLSVEPLHKEVNFRWAYFPPDGKKRVIKSGKFAGRCEVNQHELLLNINWCIIGAESGNDTGKYRYRPCKLEWIEQLVTHCQEAGTAIFIKQLGTHLAKEMKLKDRHGRNIEEFPEHLKIQTFPDVSSVRKYRGSFEEAV